MRGTRKDFNIWRWKQFHSGGGGVLILSSYKSADESWTEDDEVIITDYILNGEISQYSQSILSMLYPSWNVPLISSYMQILNNTPDGVFSKCTDSFDLDTIIVCRSTGKTLDPEVL